MGTFNWKVHAARGINGSKLRINDSLLEGPMYSTPTEISRFDNGMQLVVRRVPGVETTLAAFSVNYGDLHSRYQFDRPTAHFLEHMLFRETEKRSSRELWAELFDVAIKWNGITFDDATMYYLRAVRSDAPRAIEMLSDMMRHSRIRPKIMRKEKGPIAQEYATMRDEPYYPAYAKLESILFAGHAAGRPSIFTDNEIASIRHGQVLQTYSEQYVPSNAIFTLYGAVTEDAERAVKEYFGDMEGKFQKTSITPASVGQEMQVKTLKRRGLNQAQIVVGIKFPAINPSTDLLQLLSMDLLTEIVTDTLWAKARTDKGLVYGIQAAIDPHETHAYTAIWSGTSPKKLDYLKDIIFKILDRTAEGEISQKEIDRNRRLVLRNSIANTEMVEDSGNDLALVSTVLKRPDLAEKRPELLRSITLDSMREAAQRNLDTDRSVTVLLRPHGT